MENISNMLQWCLPTIIVSVTSSVSSSLFIVFILSIFKYESNISKVMIILILSFGCSVITSTIMAVVLMLC